MTKYFRDSPGTLFAHPRRVRRPARSLAMPIVDAHCAIVGWTKTAPKIVGQKIRHAEAEHLVGAIDACFVEIDEAETAARAGAPTGWKGPWRCLAICSANITTRMTPERLIVRVRADDEI